MLLSKLREKKAPTDKTRTLLADLDLTSLLANSRVLAPAETNPISLHTPKLLFKGHSRFAMFKGQSEKRGRGI